MKNLKELADLSTVINQVRTIINTSGLSRFSKQEINDLKSSLLQLEQKFVKGVLAGHELNKLLALEIANRAAEERQKLSQGSGDYKAIVVGATGETRTVTSRDPVIPQDMQGTVNIEPVQTSKLDSAVPAALATEIPVAPTKPAPKMDPELNARLAAAKKELVEKSKRKSVKKT